MATKKISDLQLRSDFDETCNLPTDDASQTWRVTGAQMLAFMQDNIKAPTKQILTSGSGTYTTPEGVRALKVRMVGGGGGGAGSGTSAGTAAGDGGNTAFGTSLLTANGGVAGVQDSSSGSTGGTTTINSPATGIGITGGNGAGSTWAAASGVRLSGANGGNSFFGGAGNGSVYGVAGVAGATNSGSGGSGGSGNGAVPYNGAGGGAGGYIEAWITSPDETYAYSVGAAGTAGGAGTSGYAGGAGGSGVIIVEEFY